MGVKAICNICHDIIDKQHVFSKNNQVYLKQITNEGFFLNQNNDEWFPINFQWVSPIELQNNFNHQSNKSSK